MLYFSLWRWQNCNFSPIAFAKVIGSDHKGGNADLLLAYHTEVSNQHLIELHFLLSASSVGYTGLRKATSWSRFSAVSLPIMTGVVRNITARSNYVSVERCRPDCATSSDSEPWPLAPPGGPPGNPLGERRIIHLINPDATGPGWNNIALIIDAGGARMRVAAGRRC